MVGGQDLRSMEDPIFRFHFFTPPYQSLLVENSTILFGEPHLQTVRLDRGGGYQVGVSVMSTKLNYIGGGREHFHVNIHNFWE